MFNKYALALHTLIKDICTKSHELSYINANQVAVLLKRSRNENEYGVWAEISGIEIENNSIKTKNGRIERYFAGGSLIFNGYPSKYAIEFYVPRFINLPFKEKLITVFHELYHISPKFDSSLRMFPGKNYQHGASIEKYDEYMEFLADKYLNTKPTVISVLEDNYEKLDENYKAMDVRKSTLPEPELFRIVFV